MSEVESPGAPSLLNRGLRDRTGWTGWERTCPLDFLVVCFAPIRDT